MSDGSRGVKSYERIQSIQVKKIFHIFNFNFKKKLLQKFNISVISPFLYFFHQQMTSSVATRAPF